MRLLSLLALALVLGLAAPAFPQAAEAPRAKIDVLAWMKGYWVGEGYGGTVETLIGPPRAGVMLCNFRHTKPDGKPGFYEVCAFEEHEGSLRFVIKHFHPNWVGWEEKDHAVQAKLARAGKDEWVFGNITVRRAGKDSLVMEMRISSQDGTARTEVLRLKRRPL